jgi:hypothetical protein
LNCVKVLPPSTREFADCEPVFVSFQVANKLKRSGMAVVVSRSPNPLVLRLRLRAVSTLHFVPWSARGAGADQPRSGSYTTSGVAMKFKTLKPGSRK